MRKAAVVVFAFLVAANAAAQVDLRLYMGTAKPVDAGLPFTLEATVSNSGKAPANGVTLAVDLYGATGFGAVPEGCAAVGTRMDCRLGVVNTTEFRKVVFEVIAPEKSLDYASVIGELRSNEMDAYPPSNRSTSSWRVYNTFYVVNANDSGFGSFREAIQLANGAMCIDIAQCKIAFRIPPGEAKWQTIKLATPLPAIKNDYVMLDASTQSRYFADTNPDGPEIELTGTALTSGSGIQLDACGDIRGFAVNGFADNGIVTTKACRYFYPQSITDCYVGVDPTGEKAVPNGRGIFLGARYGYIGGNVISGNARSGLFVNSGAAYIYGNAIGLNAKKTAPLGNGASGVYIAPAAAGTDLTTNHIAFNHHAGVSIAKEATMVEVIGNSIHANWQLAVDYGLDGVTARVPIRAEGPNQTFLGTGSMSMPQITSAVYDSATDTTTIDATIAFERSPAYNSLYLNVYANDAPDESGYGEGQYFLGQVGCGYPTERCTMKLQGRPPGPYISTTGMSWQYYGWLVTDPDGSQFCGDCGHTQTTSEFSKTVRITER